jgi:hypothetical protein
MHLGSARVRDPRDVVQFAASVPGLRTPPGATALAAAQTALVSLLEAWRDQLDNREYATLVELHGRWVDRERSRVQTAERRRRRLRVVDGRDNVVPLVRDGSSHARSRGDGRRDESEVAPA